MARMQAELIEERRAERIRLEAEARESADRAEEMEEQLKTERAEFAERIASEEARIAERGAAVSRPSARNSSKSVWMSRAAKRRSLSKRVSPQTAERDSSGQQRGGGGRPWPRAGSLGPFPL